MVRLFTKLLTGCPVLKVASRRGLQQWYYDRLRPWINYIPVEAEMEDLADKVLWLRSNDDVARRIGAAGRDLADSLTDPREIAGSAAVFAAAIRAARGDDLIAFAFGTTPVDPDVLMSGWHGPDSAGLHAVGIAALIELPKPPGFGGYVLNCDVSPGPGEPRRLIVTANGEPVVKTMITQRARIACELSHEVATARQRLALCFWSPDEEGIVSQSAPRDSAWYCIGSVSRRRRTKPAPGWWHDLR